MDGREVLNLQDLSLPTRSKCECWGSSTESITYGPRVLDVAEFKELLSAAIFEDNSLSALQACGHSSMRESAPAVGKS